MKNQQSKKRLEIRIEARLKALRAIGPMIAGSLSENKTRCGNSNCKCASGEKHISHLLTWKEEKKTKALYVPKDMVKEVQNWIIENKRIQRLIQEITMFNHQIIKLHVKTKRAKAKNRQNLQKT